MRAAACFTFLVLTAALHATAAAAAAAAPALPDWLAGHWCSERAEAGSEEQWLAPAGGLMLGVSRSVTRDRPTQFEFMRIELADGVPVYVAQPQGGAATRFARSAGDSGWIRFSNPAHDFPQHIEYRREGERLRASIRGPGEDGQELRIDFGFKRCAG